jgi:signal transduction histidine kinase
MNKKVLIPFLVGFILLMVVTLINRSSFNQMKKYAAAVNHSREVITSLERLSNHFKSAQIYSPNHDEAYEGYFYLYKSEAEGLQREVDRLKRLVQFNPEQRRRVDSIGRWIDQQKDVLLQKNITELIETDEGARLQQLFLIHLAINEGVVNELNVLGDREIELQDFTRLTSMLTTIFVIIAVGLIIWTFVSNVVLARKRNWLEGFLESVLNTTQNGVISYKALREGGNIVDFEVEFANPAIKKLLGANPSKIIGKKLGGLADFVQEYGLQERFKQVAETGAIQELEVCYQRKQVSRWFTLLLAKRGDGITATFHDITDLKQYEAQLKEKILALENSNTELEQYAYAASHDLQEPLRKIQIFSNYLEETQKERLDEKGKLHLNRIINAAQRMSVLIKDILTFSSIKQEDAFVATDLNIVVNNVKHDLEIVVEQKNARLEVDTLPVIEAVPYQMNQLFYNLINNALKFSHPDRELHVQLTSSKLTQAEIMKYDGLHTSLSYYKISCIDNGIGFDQKVAEQIFGLFKRLGDRHEYPGSGIGLALCRKVVINHNGVIYAEGADSEGASFYVILPEKQMTANV